MRQRLSDSRLELELVKGTVPRSRRRVLTQAKFINLNDFPRKVVADL
jgi:hypothetical protein